jgi:iron complex outermembrane receptor protein
MRSFVCSVLATVLPSVVLAQVADTTRRDTAKVALPEITVTVTRSPEVVARVPAAVGVVDRRDIRGNQATLGLDESLNNLPGVYVANRYNYSLDQRISIRGFGSRANFGLRGVKVLLDGVPQTLPDGQSQLTNVDFANLDRIEVLRGSSSSLYGNASGGVLSLTSEPAAAGPFSQSARVEGGSFGLFKVQSRTSGRSGPLSGVLSVSHTDVDGFRQHSATRFTQLSLGGDYLASGSTRLGVRFAYTDAPKAENPGALTRAEVFANPDSAAANNLLRKADKDVSQGQLALTGTHYTSRGRIDVAVFGFLRNLDNPLATPPPQGPGPTVGTYITIDRQVYGIRLGTEQRLGASERAPRLSAGVDLQRMRDNRTNSRSVAGTPDTLILDQTEKVTEVGPFAQLHWNLGNALALSAGGRFDAVRFQVDDHFFGDGADNSGERTMSALSGNAGVSYVRDPRFNPYLSVSTSFETPTTTELVNQQANVGGFNTKLDPQRAVMYEAGARGEVGPVSYTVSGFIGRIRDAIVPFTELSGRSLFTNAGKLKNDGIELGLSGRVVDRLRLFGNWTWANYRFDRYRVQRVVNGNAVIDTLDGKRLAGVPKAFIRLGLRAGPVRGFSLDLDHTMASSIFADDLNSQYVNGWGTGGPGVINGVGLGVTNARVSWEGRAGGAWVRPFLGVNNLWDRTYVGSLTINGVFGRVFEPAPGRNWYLGGEVGWAALGR